MQSPQAYVEDKEVTDTGFGATKTERRDEHKATPTFEPLPASQHNDTKRSTIIMKTHDGDGYVLPYLPWEATKTQIEKIYQLRHCEKLAEAVKDGRFSILTTSGDIILPSLWDQVVTPFSTVQTSLPSDILNPDVASYYSNKENGRPVYRPRRSSFVHREDNPTDPDVEDVEVVVDTGNDDDSGSDEESDTDFTDGASELSKDSGSIEPPLQTARPAVNPLDDDGSNISFQVNTASVGPSDRVTANTNDALSEHEPRQQVRNAEYLGITKAITMQAEGRTTLQLHILPGPRRISSPQDTSVRWYHLHSERLDFGRLKETCLGTPGLSERLHKLLRKLFERVEKDKVKVFLGGMFIEPGTVLRADESHQSDPQSVIFSCVPYFDLHTPAKKTTAAGQNSMFSSRTLMQSYYPYEPVQERDAEQAYRIFGNKQHNALVHVPNLWMVNIGSNIVVTYGHQALSKSFVQSIEVVRTSYDYTEKDKGLSTNVRLTDWSGHKLIYTLEECRTYFQMEQKLKELRWHYGPSRYEKSLQLSWQILDSSVKVTPGLWSGILRQTDTLFIDLSLTSSTKEDNKDENTAQLPSAIALSPNPFFQWPQSTSTAESNIDGVVPEEVKRSVQCLEHVEKAMLSEVLSNYVPYSAVEKTFTSTAYYRALPEDTSEHTGINVKSLHLSYEIPTNSTATGHTVHHALVIQQRNTIAKKTSELYEVMHMTLTLFVADVDKSTLLRKLWAAMNSICVLAETTCRRKPVNPDEDLQLSPQGARRSTAQRGWFVRPDTSKAATSDALQKLNRAFEKCRHCRTTKMYSSSQAALQHLQEHFKYMNSSASRPSKPEQWVVNYAQMELEVWNAGVIAILAKACHIAQQMFIQAKELSEGVRNEDGQMSGLFKFPRSLLSAFRQLLIFYFAVERAMYYTEEEFGNKGNVFQHPEYMAALPFSSSNLQILDAFGNGVQQALASARNELCSMVKSTEPAEIIKRLSLNPEYVCGWLMRRLIVKPLEKSMTVSDMYREYLSTIQFQVNHRPGKRLLRSINLLQEELTALQEVNTQQSKLISNYVRVLDDSTYEKNTTARRAMFPYERMLLASCLDTLDLTAQEYGYLLARCGPLADSTKQSLEINEEDHGKAILVFTIVTVIFLPLSFVTSFFGMNTTDIRDMGSSSTLFWAIAIPLTAVTMGSVLYIGYNGDDLRDAFDSFYRTVTGKQDRSTSARGISVIQRRRARKSTTDSNTTLDFKSLADEAEFANPQPENYYQKGDANYGAEVTLRSLRRQFTLEPPTMQWEQYVSAANPPVPEPRAVLRTQTFGAPAYTTTPTDFHRVYGRRTGEYLNHERSKRYPDVTIYNAPHTDENRPEVQTFDEPIAVDYTETIPMSTGRVRPPPPQRRYSPPLPPAQLPHYEWTRKSHRHQRFAREGTRRTRDDGRVQWNEDDEDAWYSGRARHVPAPRR